ncbi:ABC transporter ATP-binding protein [soil metagenome]
MESNLAKYIWKHTSRQQLWILFIVLASMPTYFLSFDLPKLIVNGPIQGKGFDTPDATQTFLRLAFDPPDWLSSAGPFVLFDGFSLNRFQMLMALSAGFLLLVIINGLFKFYINTYKGRLGERMLRRLRFELIDRVLRFPPGHFKRVKSSEVATMVKDEVEPLGGFIGDAFVQPAFLGGQAVTALVFIMVQNFWLGLLAAVMVGIQGLIIPKMRRRLIILGRERQLTARQLAGRVGEIVDGIANIHVHDTSNFERADIGSRLGRIFKIRYDIYQWKFFVKFLNNFLAQLTPFLFYAIGGYLAIWGNLDIGQLVAVISAYKDLPSPIKDLIDWDQQRLDVQVKYAQVFEQFNVDRLIESHVQTLASEPAPAIEGPLSLVNLTVSDDSGGLILENISVEFQPGEKVAIVGTSVGGGEVLAETLVRLSWPDGGRIRVAGNDIEQLPESVLGRRIAYASFDAHLMQGTVRDNLLYVLKHAPLTEYAYEGEMAVQRKWERNEAYNAGNPDYDLRSDWVDYVSAGATGPDDLFPAIQRSLDAVMMTQDIFELGLRASLHQARESAFVDRIKEVRAALHARLEEKGLADVIAPFEEGVYNTEATVAENLLFGVPVGSALAGKSLAANPYFRSVLEEHELDEALYHMGLEMARNAIELFRDLQPDNPLFQQLTFMTAEELPDIQALLQKLEDKAFADVSEADRDRIVAFSFSYIEPRFRFGLLDDVLQARIVAARKSFYENLPEDLKDAVERYDPEVYIRSASVLDNVLFGRIGQRHADGAEQIRDVVREVLDQLKLSDDVLDIGLDYNVGVGGKRLTNGQRQKIHVARALLKRADFIIFNKPLNALDLRAQEQITVAVLKEIQHQDRNPALLWVLSTPLLARHFDRVIVLDRGTKAEDGKHDDLMTQKGIFAELVS